MLYCVHHHGIKKLASVLLAFVAITLATRPLSPPPMDNAPPTLPFTCMRRQSAILSPPDSQGDCPTTYPVPNAGLHPPHAPISFTPEQLKMLRAQISILKAIKKGSPVPRHIRQAVLVPNQPLAIPNPQTVLHRPESPDADTRVDDSAVVIHNDVGVIPVNDALEKCTIAVTVPPRPDQEEEVEVVDSVKGSQCPDGLIHPIAH
ncbi:hypothetical protein GSI_15455 [Ganoderma sinense ZZ0214-1]|uniref:QLQ domain-containing protein n=1 Tax=Ganoderma sinense ZZ0214-1 TaxID=1077348 RepID=A0A2G8RMN5_9APHY|nr:hypothetical protein GSI_15455 [Ganoderma sinense ZZ0214-1]